MCSLYCGNTEKLELCFYLFSWDRWLVCYRWPWLMTYFIRYTKIHPCNFTHGTGGAVHQQPTGVGDGNIFLERENIQKSLLHFTTWSIAFSGCLFPTPSSLNSPHHYLRLSKIWPLLLHECFSGCSLLYNLHFKQVLKGHSLARFFHAVLHPSFIASFSKILLCSASVFQPPGCRNPQSSPSSVCLPCPMILSQFYPVLRCSVWVHVCWAYLPNLINPNFPAAE